MKTNELITLLSIPGTKLILEAALTSYMFSKSGEFSEAEILRAYGEVPLLIIDDIGSEQPTEWGSSKIFEIINTRYEGYMPTVITTNYSSSALKARMTPSGQDGKNAEKTLEAPGGICWIDYGLEKLQSRRQVI